MNNNQETPPIVEYPEIRAELIQMKDKEQEARKNMKTEYELDLELQELDNANTERLKKIVEDISWPTIPKVGEDGSTSAWLIAQHSNDLEFMKKCLELMKEVPDGEVDKIEIAYLDDRIRVTEGRSQIYGTQFYPDKPVLLPIEDIEKADALRKELGMPSLKEDADEHIRKASKKQTS